MVPTGSAGREPLAARGPVGPASVLHTPLLTSRAPHETTLARPGPSHLPRPTESCGETDEAGR